MGDCHGRLSWLLLAAALQGSASTRSPERRELHVVVASIDYVSMRKTMLRCWGLYRKYAARVLN